MQNQIRLTFFSVETYACSLTIAYHKSVTLLHSGTIWKSTGGQTSKCTFCCIEVLQSEWTNRLNHGSPEAIDVCSMVGPTSTKPQQLQKNSKKGSSFSEEIAISCSQGSDLYHFKKLYLNFKGTIQSGTALKISKILSSNIHDVGQDR